MEHLLIVISGPSGVGKGCIVGELLKRHENYSVSVSCTTRKRRINETEGVNYFYITKEKFENMIRDGEFLEYSNHFGNYYGTPKAFVEERLKTGDVVLEIEVNGAAEVKRLYPESLMIMVLPPSWDELKSRLKKRGTEDEKSIDERIERAKYELSKINCFDNSVVNDKLTTVLDEIEKIIADRKNSATVK